MRVFVAVAEEAGFAAAARRLAVSPPSVTRAVAALEQQVGVLLFKRTTRHVRLTDAGVRYLGDCKRILLDVEEADVRAAGSHSELGGSIALTAPVLFGRLHVGPIAFAFLEKHAKVTLHALFVDRVVDLIEEGIDVAVRIADLADSSAVAVRVGTVRRVICASPAYLERRGTPQRPADLSRHDAIGFHGSSSTRGWSFGKGTKSAQPSFRLVVNSSDVAVEAALAGQGLLRTLSYQVDRELRAGRLKCVLVPHEPRPSPIHVVYSEGRRASARVRTFVDFAVDRLRASLKDLA